MSSAVTTIAAPARGRGCRESKRRAGGIGGRERGQRVSDRTRDSLERTQEVFDFLCGECPKGYRVSKSHMPQLTPDQAWTVIWYLGNQYWEVPDFIERCDICGALFDTNSSGSILDYGRAPHHFCDDCLDTDTWYRKARRNPDRNARPDPREGKREQA